MEQTPSQKTPKSPNWFVQYKKLFLLLSIPIVIALISIFGLYANQPVALSDEVALVEISSTGFMPQTLKVKKGQVVTWTNSEAMPHRLEADADKLESFETTDTLKEGDSYSYIFDKDGMFYYYDPDNPQAFLGTVVVGDE